MRNCAPSRAKYASTPHRANGRRPARGADRASHGHDIVYSRRVEASHRSLFAVRVVRPYQTEDEFLREEAFALTAASIVLVGAGPRTDGVILRFEVVLESGAIMLRGEGRVAGYVPTPLGEGLLLRFTRLDPRSKALVDRAAPRSANDQAVIISPLSIPPPPAAPSSRPASVPPFPTRDPAEAPASVAPTAEVPPLESTPAESDPRESVLPSDRPTTEPSFAEGAPGSDRLTIESSPRECVPPSDRPTSELLERAPPPRSVAPPSVSPSRSMAATAESVAPPPESAPSRSAAPPAESGHLRDRVPRATSRVPFDLALADARAALRANGWVGPNRSATVARC